MTSSTNTAPLSPIAWLVENHRAADPRPDPVSAGTVEHLVMTLLAGMPTATVYDLDDQMGNPGRAVVRSAIRRLEEKGVVERDHIKLFWHIDHPVTKTWWRLVKR